MPRRLLITNGSAAVELARRAGFDGTLCSWDDVLHDGPVPGGLDDRALREVRARFIADVEWESLDAARERFETRDALLEMEFDEIVCWFEHDLYDQLQLIQVLDRLHRLHRPVTLAQADTFIGRQKPDEARAGLDARLPVTDGQYEVACTAWSAFTAPSPEATARFVEANPRSMPHLVPALQRWCASFPGVLSGLTRTEQEVLTLIEAGVRTPAELFLRTQASEQAAFRGDASFGLVLRGLSTAPCPLIATESGRPFQTPHDVLRITADGVDVLEGRDDALALRGIDTWRGGTHLTASNEWRWSARTGFVQ